MKISHAIEIERSPEEVFSWIKDPERAKEWMTSVAETELLSGTPNTVGSTFREVVRDQNSETEMHGVVTGYEENQMLSFHLRGEYNTVDVEFRVKKIGARTRVTQSADIRWRGFMKVMSIFLGRRIKKEIMAQSQSEFETLKTLCETK
jgi:carbon monoxide dehydrogenase subunit G